MYANGSFSIDNVSGVSIGSVVFTGVIACVKEQLASSVAILRAWSYVIDP